jgi:hypothetical protein
LNRQVLEASAFEHFDAQSAETLAANLIAGEGVLLDERDAQASAGEQKGGEAPGGAGADDQGIEHGRSVARSGDQVPN